MTNTPDDKRPETKIDPDMAYACGEAMAKRNPLADPFCYQLGFGDGYSQKCPRCGDLFYDPKSMIADAKQHTAEWEEIARKAMKENQQLTTQNRMFKQELHKISLGIPSEWAFAKLGQEFAATLTDLTVIMEELAVAESALVFIRNELGERWPDGTPAPIANSQDKAREALARIKRFKGEG